jgi:hypothetical protein
VYGNQLVMLFVQAAILIADLLAVVILRPYLDRFKNIGLCMVLVTSLISTVSQALQLFQLTDVADSLSYVVTVSLIVFLVSAVFMILWAVVLGRLWRGYRARHHELNYVQDEAQSAIPDHRASIVGKRAHFCRTDISSGRRSSAWNAAQKAGLVETEKIDPEQPLRWRRPHPRYLAAQQLAEATAQHAQQQRKKGLLSRPSKRRVDPALPVAQPADRQLPPLRSATRLSLSDINQPDNDPEGTIPMRPAFRNRFLSSDESQSLAHDLDKLNQMRRTPFARFLSAKSTAPQEDSDSGSDSSLEGEM